MDPGFWVALFAFLTAAMAGLFGYFNNRLKVQPEIAALRGRVSALETAHRECEEHRLKLQSAFSTAWPSDPSAMIAAMEAMARLGQNGTIADVIRFIRGEQAAKPKT